MALDGSSSTSSAASSPLMVVQTSELPDQQQQQQQILKEEEPEALHKNKSSVTTSTTIGISSSSSSNSSTTSSNNNGGNMPRSPVFSSDEEEPIIMSPDLFATVRQDAQLVQAQQQEVEDGAIPPLLSFGTIHASYINSNPVLQQQQQGTSLWKHFGTWDTSYTTSTLTRHTQNEASTATTTSTALEGISLMIMRDVFQFLTIMQQSPLQWPGIFLRMMRLIWQGGPASYSSSSLDHNDYHDTNKKWLSALTSRQQQQCTRLSSSSSASHLPPVVHGIPNFGQTCFLNVILQSLASIDSVLAYSEWIATEQERRQQDEDYYWNLGLDDEDEEHNAKHRRRSRSAWRRRQKHQQPTSTVSQLLFPILQALNGQVHDQNKKRNIDPRELLWRIAQKNPQFQSNRHQLFGMTVPSSSSTGEQQDAQEVLQALLEMMIVDAHLEDSYTLPPPSAPSSQRHHHNYGRSDSADVVEEKKDDTVPGGGYDVLLLGGSSHYEDDEILTVLSDRRSPRNSSNNSACSSVVSNDDDNNRKRSDSDNSVEEKMGTWDNNNKNGGKNGSNHTADQAAWNHVHMIDSTGMISSYHSSKVNKKAGNDRLAAKPNGSTSLAASSMESSSLASSFLSTTSTVVTSPSASTRERQRQPQPQQQGPTMSASMQIMLSTISSITKTPLSCWTGSLVQCQTCRHVKAVRNQEWRDIPIVPTAVSAPMMTAARSMGGSPSKVREGVAPPPCTLEECLQDFTQVEGVEDVECANCTLQQQIQKWQDEVDLLRGAVESLERKRAKQQQLQLQHTNKKGNESSNNNQLDSLHVEFEEAETRLRKLQQQDPDEYEPPIHDESGDGNCDDGRPIKMLRANALKCLVLTRLPSVLCLHVQRRCYDPMTNRMSKTMQHVAFDEILDLAPYCAFGGNENARKFFNMRNNHNGNPNGNSRSNGNSSSSQQHRSPILYRLASVVEHRGNAFGGHYLCYRRLPAQFSQSHQSAAAAAGTTHAWYYCSDDTIQEVSWNQVRTAQAYMLFYEAV